MTLNSWPQTVPPSLVNDPLLWVLRDHFGLIGTKYGCGIGACGACTVHVDGEARRSCVTTAREVAGRRIVTIEGLAQSGALHPVQQSWIAESVPQCGYCQAGQIMQAAALLARNPHPSDAELTRVMDEVLCRCGTQARVRRAIRRASALLSRAPAGSLQEAGRDALAP
ncbi:MAG TPA: (2Fe-2S)-binding protein [Microvirga sp.]|nr:(2Fe-2S)-binding protein [Microvirga sp.]